MLRLQHYIELCYLILGVFVLIDVARTIKLQMCPKPRDIMRVFALLAISPLFLLYLAVNFIRKEW